MTSFTFTASIVLLSFDPAAMKTADGAPYLMSANFPSLTSQASTFTVFILFAINLSVALSYS